MGKTDSKSNLDKDAGNKRKNNRRYLMNKNISRDKRKIWREDQMRLQDKMCME